MNCVDPGKAFYPDNSAVSGGRLLSMMNLHEVVTIERFLSGFDRLNMHYGKHWNLKLARQNAPRVIQSLQNRRVIVMGRGTLATLCVTRMNDFTWNSEKGITYTCLPHPSGLTRDYNDPEYRERVGEFLLTELQNKCVHQS